MRRILVIVLAVALTGLGFLPITGQSQRRLPISVTSRGEAISVPGELLVQFKAGASSDDRGRALNRIDAEELETVVTEDVRSDGLGDLVLVRIQPDLTQAATTLRLREDAAVEFAEPNWVYTHQATSTDPYFVNGGLWGMYGSGTSPANEYGSNAAAAWAAGNTGSNGVYVGVIDEGIQFSHEDLNGQVWTNPFDAADGIDNDGNGYIDDIHGWDFSANNNSIYDGGNNGKQDDHGTHVSGTIGAQGENGKGVVGVNWNVTIISAKFLGRSGGTTANAVKAIDYITDLKTRHGLNIVATNNSWGGGGFSQSLKDAIERANKEDILFVAAAGNGGFDGVGDNNDTTPSYPSNYTSANIIAVASITSTGSKSSFSNYGLTTVDIGAPGSSIRSTTAFNLYSIYSGTSMATPHVTGACALYASTHPGASAAHIKNAILTSAAPTASLAGRCVSGGRLDVGKLLK